MDFDDRWDHVARALDLDDVVDADVAFGEQPPVVQRGAADRDSREFDGLEFGDGRDRAGPADLRDDSFDAAGAAPRRELEC
jgi:hypothetical protein